MGAVAGGVALAEAAAAPAMSFADAPGPDPAAAILDEVLGGSEAAPTPAEKDTESAAAVPEGEPKPDKPETPSSEAKTPEPVKPPAETPEAAKLRAGFAKLADERQKVLQRENAARETLRAAQQYEAKAKKHDEMVAALEKDPAAFILAHGGEKLVQAALQGFIDQEKSPAEREVARMRADLERRDAEQKQRDAEQAAANWRNDITAKVKADERFDLVNTLGLHDAVIGVITSYYEKHSERGPNGEVTRPAILDWSVAAQAVEDHRAGLLENSKRYGKRTPAASAPETAPKKDAPPAKPAPAPAKKAPTSLSSVPVSETPSDVDDLSDVLDPDERERRVLAQLGL